MIKWKLKLVDGYKIRNTLDTNFAGYSTADYAAYVPAGEIWLEDYLQPERAHFLNLATRETRWFKQGKSFEQLWGELTQEAQKQLPRPEFALKSQQKNGLKIIYVNGALVRKFFDPYFLLGGHDLVYPYIPANEIWLDALNYEKDQPFTLIHELHERRLMAKKMDYESAHDFALAQERYWRRKKGVARFLNG